MTARYVGRWPSVAGFCDGPDPDAVLSLTIQQASFNACTGWSVTDTLLKRTVASFPCSCSKPESYGEPHA
jgi:hypothetical protein